MPKKYGITVVCSCGEEHPMVIIEPDTSDEIVCTCGIKWTVKKD